MRQIRTADSIRRTVLRTIPKIGDARVKGRRACDGLGCLHCKSRGCCGCEKEREKRKCGRWEEMEWGMGMATFFFWER